MRSEKGGLKREIPYLAPLDYQKKPRFSVAEESIHCIDQVADDPRGELVIAEE